MSWTPNLTDRNKWERLARTQLGTLVAASVSFDETTKFSVDVCNVNTKFVLDVNNNQKEVADNVTKITKNGFATVQAAKEFADQNLTHFGYSS